MGADAVRVGVIGCGYWGPNLVRNFMFNSGFKVEVCCDLDQNRLDYIKQLYPVVRTTTDQSEVLGDPHIDVIAVATPVQYHYPLVKEALERGKHVLVEKPLTADVAQARELEELASRTGKVLLVGHTFLYSPGIRKVREVIQKGDLGRVLYVRTARMSLGLFQKDINVVWDLAPHDVSILLYLLAPRTITSARAWGTSHVTEGIEDLAQVELTFDDGLAAYVQLSWLDPLKTRSLTVVGDQKMLNYVDTSPTEPLRIYDTGVKGPRYYDSFGEFLKYSYWVGDTYIPRIDNTEPLKIEVQHLLDCIRSGEEPLSGGKNGREVVAVLEAINRSLRSDGARVPIALA